MGAAPIPATKSKIKKGKNMPYKDRDKQREYQRVWYANRRAEYFKDKKCFMCGSTEALELDHINPAKKVSHRIWSWCAVKRDMELAKCQVLCYDCHKQKTCIDRKYKRYLGGAMPFSMEDIFA